MAFIHRIRYVQQTVPPAVPSDEAWAAALLAASNRCIARRALPTSREEEKAREELDRFRPGRL